MMALCPNRIRNLCILGAFLSVASILVRIHSMAAEIRLSPPGLRLKKDPSLVIPADFHYTNPSIPLPAYRDASGKPQKGWSAQYVGTRRFASDQSARIFFRNSDLQRSVSADRAGGRGVFRFWPVGTTIVMEIYKGDAPQAADDKLIEIAAMSKIEPDDELFLQAFYPANWAYARFDSDRNPVMISSKVRECHQCHSIAFHYTGDLIFTQFP